jgi:hypothetical protein
MKVYVGAEINQSRTVGITEEKARYFHRIWHCIVLSINGRCIIRASWPGYFLIVTETYSGMV